MRIASWYILVFLLLVLIIQTRGQQALQPSAEKFKMIQYSLHDGLTSDIISSVMTDQLGYVWTRTETGIAKFDGYEFESFDYDPNNRKNIYQKVSATNSLYLDLLGNIWVNYEGLGISYYDPVKGYFINFKPDDQQKDYIGNYDIFCFYAKDSSTLWIGTNKGLFSYNYTSKKFIKIETIDFAIQSIFVDNIGNVWMGAGEKETFNSGQGLVVFDSKKNKAVKIGRGSERISDIKQDRDGRIWLATSQGIGRVRDYSPGISGIENAYYELETYSGDYSAQDIQRNNFHTLYESAKGDIWALANIGMVRVNEKNNAAFQLQPYLEKEKLDNINLSKVIDIGEDLDGNLWVLSSATEIGLARYDKTTDTFLTKWERFAGLNKTDWRFISMHIDQNNIIWLGTERFGLLKYDLYQQKFRDLKSINENAGSLSSNKILSITKGKDNSLWIGTSYGLNHYNPNKSSVERYNVYNSSINGNTILSSLIDSKGTLWLGHTPDQVSRIDLDTWQNDPLKYIVNGDTTGFFGWSISALAEDLNNDVWVASHAGGIYQVSGNTGEFKNYQFFDQKQKIVMATNSLLVDAQNNLWIGTTYGLYILNRKTDQLEEFKGVNGKALIKEGVISMEELGNTLLIGTQSGGLIRLNPQNRELVRITTHDGLPSNVINAQVIQNDSIFWLGTGNGLCRLNINSMEISNFSVFDGLPTDIFNANSATVAPNGIVYFGTANGLLYFHPDSIVVNRTQSKPLLTSFALFNQAIGVGDTVNGQLILQKSLAFTDHITLNHENYIFSIGFSSMHMASPNNNRYAYKLDNLDKDWNYVDATRRLATYTSLPPGDYIFRLKATNSSGIWSDEETILNIRILPPWWGTFWFRLLLLCLMIVAGYAFFFIRIRSVRNRNKALQMMVRKKTEGLHEQNKELLRMTEKVHEADKSKLRYFINISHELRTPLTLILGPTQNLIASSRLNDDDREDVKLIERNGHRLLRLTNQLLDSSELDKEILKLQVSNGDIIHFVMEIAKAFRYHAESKNISYEIIPSISTRQTGWFDGDKIEKILYNLISNAFKFTKHGGKVKVSAMVHGINLEVSVEDNGVGMENEELERVFDRFYQVETNEERRSGTGIGLNLAKKLSKKHKGSLKANSVYGLGSIFTLHIPIDEESYTASEKVKSHINIDQRVEDIQKLFARYSPPGNSVTMEKERKNVLIVEDSEDMRQYLRNGLKFEFNVMEAENGLVGIKIAEECFPDIIVSDIMMPNMNGLDLCEKLKESEISSHIPIILLTAKVGEQHQIEGYESGADDYLTKPIKINLLIARINNLISAREKLKEAFSSANELMPENICSQKGDKVFLERVIKIIESNLENRDLNHKTFVEELGISKTALYNKINSLTGLSINLFVRSIRLKIAKKLIKETAYNLSEISYKTGFSDPSYFSKCFKQEFDITPKEYAEQLVK